jgi:hypothetical protein
MHKGRSVGCKCFWKVIGYVRRKRLLAVQRCTLKVDWMARYVSSHVIGRLMSAEGCWFCHRCSAEGGWLAVAGLSAMLGTDVHLEAFPGLERLTADRAGVKESCRKITFKK